MAGAKQVWGAQRRAACKLAFPLALPDASQATFHLIVVTHGGSIACQQALGGSGSLMVNTGLKGFDAHVDPFMVGDLDTATPFVHVLDDTTLNVLMRTLDTITDFTSYLRKKENLLRAPMSILAAGEEELLANYLKNLSLLRRICGQSKGLCAHK